MSPSHLPLPVLLQQRATDEPHALAFSFGGTSVTWSQLREDAEELAGILRHDGVVAGDRVALLMPAGLDLVRLVYALLRLEAAPCIFDPHVPAETTARRTAAIRPRITLTAPPRGASTTVPPVSDDDHAIAFLQSTSGTSGEPLFAMLTHRNILASLAAAHELIDPTPTDVLVGWVPPWHDLGLLRFVLAPLYFGIPCHLIAPAIRTVPEWFATISRERGTITGAPDFAWRLASRLVDPRNVDLRSLRFATNGGEPVRASTIAAFESRFGIERIIRPGYGLAEATLGVTSTRSGEAIHVDERGNVSCGPKLLGVDIRIEDGEIVVRSPAVFTGYFESSGATSHALRDGWLYTGDAGVLDDDGRLFVLGRRRALIKRGGVALAPRELEEAAQSIAGVRVAAAVGVPSSMTEEIVVVIEVDPDSSDVEQRVHDAVERVLGFAPDRVLVQPARSIPRTPNGKIRHAVLRDQLTPSSLRSNPSESSDGRSLT
jgi:fatty-acyl-CoA synthase